MKINPTYVIIPLFVLLALVSLIVTMCRRDKIYDEVSAEYPLITPGFDFKGVVTSIDHPIRTSLRDNPLSEYLSLNDSIKLHLITSFELKSNLKLSEVIEIGDSLVKNSGSHYIYIYKVENSVMSKYEFELNDDLGYPFKDDQE